jgi:hypothetical protein
MNSGSGEWLSAKAQAASISAALPTSVQRPTIRNMHQRSPAGPQYRNLRSSADFPDQQ